MEDTMLQRTQWYMTRLYGGHVTDPGGSTYGEKEFTGSRTP